MTTTLPRTAAGTLTHNKIALETGPDEFGELRDSIDLLGDPTALRQRMADEGYLLLGGLIDRDAVLAARREILLKFAIVGEIDSINHDVMEAIRSEQTFVDQVNLFAFTDSLRTGMAYSNVVMNPALLGFFTDFLGGPVRSFDFRWPRFMRPGDGTGIHADGPYITRGTTNVWSAWIPLGNVAMADGALMVLQGSHLNEQLRRSYGSRDADRDKLGWLSTDPVGLRRRLGGRWMSTDFQAGDVLVFGPYLVHASFDNNSPVRRCRLSSDTRYQLEGDALDPRWNGDVRNPHGGRPRVFLPGRTERGTDNRGTNSRETNNKDFQEEWKDVDEYGRLL